MIAKISVFVICIEAVIYLLLYNLHNCTFNRQHILFLDIENDNIYLSFRKIYWSSFVTQQKFPIKIKFFSPLNRNLMMSRNSPNNFSSILSHIYQKEFLLLKVIYFIFKHQKRIGYANCRKNLILEDTKVLPFSATFIYLTFKRKPYIHCNVLFYIVSRNACYQK